MSERARPETEEPNPRSEGLDALDAAAAFDLFDAEDRGLHDAVTAARSEIVAAIELVSERLARGGRLLYVGAGTSGRLGVLDASECPPTFQTDPELVQGRIAGGPEAVLRSIEGAEDSVELGREAVADAGALDVVFGITASGGTPFVAGALAAARERGAATVLLACVGAPRLAEDADLCIAMPTGPEGPGRKHAPEGRHGDQARPEPHHDDRDGPARTSPRQPDGGPGHARQPQATAPRGAHAGGAAGAVRRRGVRPPDRADGRVKTALAMHRLGVDADRATALLERAGGRLRFVLERGSG